MAKKKTLNTMIGNILLLLFYITAPAGILFVCRKNKVFGKIGPVLTLYLLGVLVANIGIFPAEESEYKKLFDFMESFSGALIPLALPMILFGCNFRKFSLGKSLGAFVIGAVSVVAFVLAGYLIFKDNLGEEGPFSFAYAAIARQVASSVSMSRQSPIVISTPSSPFAAA